MEQAVEVATPLQVVQEAFNYLKRLPKEHISFAAEEEKFKKLIRDTTTQVRKQKKKDVKADYFAWLRSRQMLERKDEAFLDKHEMDKCELKCECVASIPAAMYSHISPGDEVAYKVAYDPTRQKDLYTLYSVKTLEPEHVITDVAVARQYNKNPDADVDLPDPVDQVVRFELVENQFFKYFRVD